MDKKLKGSWLIHHTNKLQTIDNPVGYEKTLKAGKAGILLSAISANEQSTISNTELDVLAKAAKIDTAFQLPSLVSLLKDRQLIDTSKAGIAVLGVTSHAALQHTADIFDSLGAEKNESVAIELAERASIAPILEADAKEMLGDEFQLAGAEISQLLSDAEQIGFVDVERIGDEENLLFNGNLFRRDATEKIKRVLDSLTIDEQKKLIDLNTLMRTTPCIPIEKVSQFLGAKLTEKLAAIGIIDINTVSNPKEECRFVTLPSSFSKFGSDSLIDDAFDLAKAFISSITYGMIKSYYERGQIRSVEWLIEALVNGRSIGPVRAIEEDYRVLELRRVVEVRQGTKNGRTGPMMRLLKKEVGELALQLVKQGDISEHSLATLPTSAVSIYHGPEANRERVRRKQVKISPRITNDMLTVLRTGGKF